MAYCTCYHHSLRGHLILTKLCISTVRTYLTLSGLTLGLATSHRPPKENNARPFSRELQQLADIPLDIDIAAPAIISRGSGRNAHLSLPSLVPRGFHIDTAKQLRAPALAPADSLIAVRRRLYSCIPWPAVDRNSACALSRPVS
jgi:hypothetical protein